MSKPAESPAKRFAAIPKLIELSVGYLSPRERLPLLRVSKTWSLLTRISFYASCMRIASSQQAVAVYNDIRESLELGGELGRKVPRKLVLAFTDYADWMLSSALVMKLSRNVLHWEVVAGPPEIARDVVLATLAAKSIHTLRLNTLASFRPTVHIPGFLGIGFPELRELQIGTGLGLTWTSHHFLPSSITHLSLGSSSPHQPSSTVYTTEEDLDVIGGGMCGVTHLHVVVKTLDDIVGLLSLKGEGLRVLSVVVIAGFTDHVEGQLEHIFWWIERHLVKCQNLEVLRLVGVPVGVAGSGFISKTLAGVKCILLPEDFVASTPAEDALLAFDHGGLEKLSCKWHAGANEWGSGAYDLVDWRVMKVNKVGCSMDF